MSTNWWEFRFVLSRSREISKTNQMLNDFYAPLKLWVEMFMTTTRAVLVCCSVALLLKKPERGRLSFYFEACKDIDYSIRSIRNRNFLALRAGHVGRHSSSRFSPSSTGFKWLKFRAKCSKDEVSLQPRTARIRVEASWWRSPMGNKKYHSWPNERQANT